MSDETNPTFKPGDKVICIARFGDALIEGQTYTVRGTDGEWIGVVEPTGDCRSIGCGWSASRFRLADPRDAEIAALRAQVTALRMAVLHAADTMRRVNDGHEGDEESGAHDPSCRQCWIDAALAEGADALARSAP